MMQAQFALPLGVWLTDQHVGRRSIIGASATLVGIVIFVAVGQPAGGTAEPAASAWCVSGLVIVALMAVLASRARRRVGSVSAALFATAAGLAFAFQAAVTKVFVTELGNGLAAILSTWTTYALIVSALAGFVLQQSALKTGYLAPTMAASNASTLAMSVVFGLAVFDETLAHGNGQLLPALIGLGLAISGVVLLAPGSRTERSTA